MLFKLIISKILRFLRILPILSVYSLHRTGRLGEKKACMYLKEKGLKVASQNWRYGKGEIDIIAWEGPVCVFIEVKTRSNGGANKGYYAVNKRKKEILQQTCKAYLKQLRKKPLHYRFDIIEVRLLENNTYNIQHHLNIPLFSKYFFVRS